MQPIVSDLVQYKNNNRDTEPLAGMIISVHDGKVDINVFRLGIIEFHRNVVMAENAESAEAGQCWLSSTVKRS
jgi:hypothetical protein